MSKKTCKHRVSSRKAASCAPKDRSIGLIAEKLFDLLERQGCQPDEAAFMLVCAARILAAPSRSASFLFHETLALAEEGVPFDAPPEESSEAATRH